LIPHSAHDVTLPNGLKLLALSRFGETEFIYRELFEQDVYLQHGVALKEGDCVLDVGANIGMFAVSLAQRFSGLKLFCFEPIPPTFAVLTENLRRHPGRGFVIDASPFGLGAETGAFDFTYYENAPGNSTTLPAEKEASKRAIKQELMENGRQHLGWKYALVLLAYPIRGALFDVAIRKLYTPASLRCEVRRLSSVIHDKQIERVDLGSGAGCAAGSGRSPLAPHPSGGH